MSILDSSKIGLVRCEPFDHDELSNRTNEVLLCLCNGPEF